MKEIATNTRIKIVIRAFVANKKPFVHSWQTKKQFLHSWQTKNHSCICGKQKTIRAFVANKKPFVHSWQTKNHSCICGN